MSIKDKLLEDLKVAMRDKDTVKKDAVQMARAAVLQFEKDKKVVLDDEGVIEIIAKEIKHYKDVLPEYEKGGRQDLVDEINVKISALTPYLPAQLSEDELRAIVSEAVTKTGALSMRDIGKIMAVVMPQVKGRCDGRVVNAMIKELLG